MNDQNFLEELKRYIEDTEILSEAEWGKGRSIEQLMERDEMPSIYAEVIKRLNAIQAV